MTENRGEELLTAGFFEGRLLMQIESWDATLALRVCSEGTPPEYRLRGAFSRSQLFELRGKLLAPKGYRGQSIRVFLSPLGQDIAFERDEPVEAGRIRFRDEGGEKTEITATLRLLEEDVGYTATCLSSIWKYLHIWISEEYDLDADISSYSFSAALHCNLDPWLAEG